MTAFTWSIAIVLFWIVPAIVGYKIAQRRRLVVGRSTVFVLCVLISWLGVLVIAVLPRPSKVT